MGAVNFTHFTWNKHLYSDFLSSAHIFFVNSEFMLNWAYGAAIERRIHLSPTNPQSTLLLYSMFCTTFLRLGYGPCGGCRMLVFSIAPFYPASNGVSWVILVIPPLPWRCSYASHNIAALLWLMAEAPGFEPGNAGIKTLCLTAWLCPNNEGFLNLFHLARGW